MRSLAPGGGGARSASLPATKLGHDVAATIGQIAMHHGNHLRAFANGSGNTLDRPGANIADGEHAVVAGFQQPPFAPGFWPGQDETSAVETERTLEPISVWLGADEEKQVLDGAPHVATGRRHAPANRLKHTVAP